MHPSLLTAWPGPLPHSMHLDLTPLGCAALLLLAAWASGLRLRWWSVGAVAAGGVPCSTLAERFGTWAPVAIALLVFLVLIPVARAGRATAFGR
jgi:hypothetical protein